ncbi:MAG: response regulator transcription factor [Oceanospirillales bacterium]|nr:response regulator transcription factor [Oceanospirillales bacterium]MBR9889482.1 response regulator transcription factor [Oceanospirillales bacterium]
MKTNNNIYPAGLYSFQDECLSLLTGVLNVSKAVTYLVDNQRKPICYKTWQLQPAMHRQYMDTFYKVDPLHPTQFVEQTGITVVKMNDLVNSQERYNHPYYRDFISPWGVQDIVELFLRVDNKLIAGFALFISKQQPEMRSEDIRKAQQLHQFMQFSLEQSLDAPKHNQFENFCDQFQLTPKERMVVELVSQGLPNKTIAAGLDCSLATVKTHLQHIFCKTGVNSKAEITSQLYNQH